MRKRQDCWKTKAKIITGSELEGFRRGISGCFHAWARFTGKSRSSPVRPDS